jgi:thiamine transporter ThiT
MPSNEQLDDTLGPALFGAAVRTIGLVLILTGLYWGLYAFLVSLGVVEVDTPMFEYLLAFVTYTVAGIALMRAAPVIVHFAYPRVQANDGDDTDIE